MSERLTKLSVRNYRSLADIEIEPGSLNILFGPNGAGKSTFLDTIWFIRDCAINGVESASSDRSHGIGVLWDGAGSDERISILIETINSRFEIEFSLSSGRIQPFVGERLHSKARNIQIIERKTGSDSASFYTEGASAMAHIPLKEPEKLALTRFVSFDSENFEAKEVDDLLRHTASYVSRQFALFDLRRRGSESNYHTHLWVRAQNLWSVLRNIHDKRSVDDRYETILDFMRKAFPAFEELVFDQSGPNSVYCEFKERHHNRTIKASGVSDGHLQFLILLTSLFSDGKEKDSLILFDEPETSLHPHALAILAEAMKKASSEWSKQIFVATHSPVLMSQFEPEDVWAVELDEEGRTILERVSAIEGVRDLLDKYGVGVLYMAESIAPQSKQIQTATVG